MDPAMEEYYIQLSLNSPNMLCSEVSVEILEAATYDDVEPSQFFRDFLEAGHTQWLVQKYGPVPQGKEQIRNAIVVLWVRACRLHVSQVLGRPDPNWDKPFFSDEGLYD